MKRKIIIIVLFLFLNIILCRSNQTDYSSNLKAAIPNDILLVGGNYNYNILINESNNSIFDNIEERNIYNFELELLYLSYKNEYFIYLGYEYFRSFETISNELILNEFQSNNKNDFIILKFKLFKHNPTLFDDKFVGDIIPYFGIGFMPRTNFLIDNEEDYLILKENEFLNKNNYTYDLNYKIGVNIEIGYTFYIKMIGNVFIHSNFAIEYINKPIITKDINLKVGLGFKINLFQK